MLLLAVGGRGFAMVVRIGHDRGVADGEQQGFHADHGCSG